MTQAFIQHLRGELDALREAGLSKDERIITSQQQADKLVAKLTRIPGVKLAFDGYRFHEAVLQLDRKVGDVLEGLAKRNIVGGLDLSEQYPELGNALLVCATETRTDADLDAYATALAAVLER